VEARHGRGLLVVLVKKLRHLLADAVRGHGGGVDVGGTSTVERA
jgi:hypothetical protein